MTAPIPSIIREWKPGCPEWITEKNSPFAEEKRRRVLERLVREDYAKPPTAELVKSWHQEMFAGIAPHPDYTGNFRDKEATPYCLQDYNVGVGRVPGTESGSVLREVDYFFKSFRDRIDYLECSLHPGDDQALSEDEVIGVVELAAWAHGEWVRIHPFANGNGRTARLLANYVLVRFGFGPALAIRPRPNQPYGRAASISMKDGDHSFMEWIIWQMLMKSYSIN